MDKELDFTNSTRSQFDVSALIFPDQQVVDSPLEPANLFNCGQVQVLLVDESLYEIQEFSSQLPIPGHAATLEKCQPLSGVGPSLM